MNNELLFIRHGKTKIDKSIPIADWDLDEKGYEQAKEVVDINEFQDVDVILSSTEKKAFLTVKPLANKLGKEIVQIKELGEIDRGKSGGSISKQEYDEMKVKIFKDLDFTDYGWETANHALNRFKKAVEEIDTKYEGKKILIAVHGSVMNLYFADLQGKLDNIFERWKKLGFGDWGIVKNRKVIKDIV